MGVKLNDIILGGLGTALMFVPGMQPFGLGLQAANAGVNMIHDSMKREKHQKQEDALRRQGVRTPQELKEKMAMDDRPLLKALHKKMARYRHLPHEMVEEIINGNMGI